SNFSSPQFESIYFSRWPQLPE
ncbi:unnamed protein product, partial [Allacma fusca]